MAQLPFIVVDQNRLGCEEALKSAAARCQAENLQMLVPDGAAFEFSKSSDMFKSWERRLHLLSRFADYVAVGRKWARMWDEEIALGRPCDQIVDPDATLHFQKLLRQICAGSTAGLRAFMDAQQWGAVTMSWSPWEQHDRNKAMIMTVRDALKTSLSPMVIKDLRGRKEEAIAQWLGSAEGLWFVFQGIASRGAGSDSALALSVTPSAIGGFISGMAALALYWIAYGGLEGAGPQILTNDLIDLEYASLGALSRSFLTSDRRATSICEAVKQGFDGRVQWFARAQQVGPSAAAGADGCG